MNGTLLTTLLHTSSIGIAMWSRRENYACFLLVIVITFCH